MVNRMVGWGGVQNSGELDGGGGWRGAKWWWISTKNLQH